MDQPLQPSLLALLRTVERHTIAPYLPHRLLMAPCFHPRSAVTVQLFLVDQICSRNAQNGTIATPSMNLQGACSTGVSLLTHASRGGAQRAPSLSGFNCTSVSPEGVSKSQLKRRRAPFLGSAPKEDGSQCNNASCRKAVWKGDRVLLLPIVTRPTRLGLSAPSWLLAAWLAHCSGPWRCPAPWPRSSMRLQRPRPLPRPARPLQIPKSSCHESDPRPRR